MGSCDILLREISQEFLKISIFDISLKIIYLILQPHLPGSNEFRKLYCASPVRKVAGHRLEDQLLREILMTIKHPWQPAKLRLRGKWPPFPDNIFKCIFLNENVKILIKISLKFVPKGPVTDIPALVQMMAWCHPGNKPLSKPMLVCVTDTYVHHSASMS